mmetsp:Transcript_17606/g.39483  ORF Transcript_17606/g.39483 Transcript_17606/m.39483 type:complete len:313 (-) Transcript_17606:873-1811(-)
MAVHSLHRLAREPHLVRPRAPPMAHDAVPRTHRERRPSRRALRRLGTLLDHQPHRVRAALALEAAGAGAVCGAGLGQPQAICVGVGHAVAPRACRVVALAYLAMVVAGLPERAARAVDEGVGGGEEGEVVGEALEEEEARELPLREDAHLLGRPRALCLADAVVGPRNLLLVPAEARGHPPRHRRGRHPLGLEIERDRARDRQPQDRLLLHEPPPDHAQREFRDLARRVRLTDREDLGVDEQRGVVVVRKRVPEDSPQLDLIRCGRQRPERGREPHREPEVAVGARAREGEARRVDAARPREAAACAHVQRR